MSIQQQPLIEITTNFEYRLTDRIETELRKKKSQISFSSKCRISGRDRQHIFLYLSNIRYIQF